MSRISLLVKFVVTWTPLSDSFLNYLKQDRKSLFFSQSFIKTRKIPIKMWFSSEEKYSP